MKLGFIGCGNMAKAMIGGIINKGVLDSNEIFVSAKTNETLKKAKEKFNVNTEFNNIDVVKNSDVVVLAVKPIYYCDVIKEIKDYVDKNKIIVSIAPGKTIELLTQFFEKKVKIARAMPNTPALVGEAMTGVCFSKNMSEDDIDGICSILKSFGVVEIVNENIMDTVGGVSGSSPAYVFMFIEAMADAAVLSGMQRDKAYKFAAQAVLGSAKMVLETDMHPAELKDMVCSPAGTTIEGVRTLEKSGLRSAVIEAINSCIIKTKEV